MNKQLILLFVLVLCAFSTLYAQTYEIGVGDDVWDRPHYNYYTNSRTQTIYLASELTAAGMTAGTQLDELNWNFSTAPSMADQAFCIRMGHTTLAEFTTTDFIVTGLTDVYNAPADFTTASGWTGLAFTTPFVWNGTDNVVIDVCFYNGEDNWGDSGDVAVTTDTVNRSLEWHSDDDYDTTASPTEVLTANSSSMDAPDVRLIHYSATQPTACTNPTPGDNAINVPINGSLTWDWGANNSTYDVWFGPVGAAAEVVTGGTCAGSSGSFSYSNLNSFAAYEWWVVAYNGGDFVESTHWSFTTELPPNQVLIGNGTVTNISLPTEPYYDYSLSQTIYWQSQIDMPSQQVEAISYYYNGVSAYTEDPTTIYMGHTALNELTGFLPLSNFVEVFSGAVSMPASAGWITIDLDVPFAYNNTDNLVVMFHADQDGYGTSSCEFFCTDTSLNTSVEVHQDNTPYDPSTPPASGSLRMAQPNTVFTFGDLPTNPVFDVNPEAMAYGEVIVGTSTTEETFTVSNLGSGPMDITDVSLVGANADQFILNDLNTYPATLNGAQSINFGVSFMPTTAGAKTAAIQITDNQRAIHTVPLTGTGWEPPYPYFEDFENGGALPTGWAQSLADQHDWTVYSGSTTSGSTGPSADHTLGTSAGYYVYYETSSPVATGDEAYLISPMFDLTTHPTTALSFWYHMYGADMGTLSVDVHDGATWHNDVWTLSGQQGDKWRRAGVCLADYVAPGPTMIRFRGVCGGPTAYWSDMAIDDVSLYAPGYPVAGDVFISEVTDNMVGQDDGTGYVELYNRSNEVFDLTMCSLTPGANPGVFQPLPSLQILLPPVQIPPTTYMLISNGADENVFKTAWGITDDILFVQGSSTLDIANGGFAYQFATPVTRATVDETPDVPALGAMVQTDIDMWTPSTPDASTPNSNSPGQTLPVELSSFSVGVTASNTVLIEWATQSESDVSGYYVLRGYSDVVADAVVASEMIPATNTSQPVDYSHEDADVDMGDTYYYWLETQDLDGSSEMFGPVSVTITEGQGPDIPEFIDNSALLQNKPNPFNPDTEIVYSIRGEVGVPVHAELAIYNVRGQRVKTLFSGMQEPVELKSAFWHGDDDNGNSVASGVYFYKLSTSGFTQINKMMLLK